jgi:hypothetical protein
MNLRVTPEELKSKLGSEQPPLLVCAYADDDKCRKLGVEEGLTYHEFEQKLPDVSQDRGIVFYCG